MKWISVSERMPTYEEAEGRYIILLVLGNGTMCPARMLTTCDGGDLIHYFQCLCKKDHFWKDEIKYWMSIDLTEETQPLEKQRIQNILLRRKGRPDEHDRLPKAL